MCEVTDIICCQNFLEEFEKIELVKKGNFVAVALHEDRRQKADVDKYLLQIVKALRCFRYRT